MKVLGGATRKVILTRRLAFKVPNMMSWKSFLLGLVSNIKEKEFSGYSHRLCPIKFSIPSGFLVVMPRCLPLNQEEWEIYFDFDEFCREAGVWVEPKIDSFGRYQGRIVAVDYG